MKSREKKSATWGRGLATLCALFLSVSLAFAAPAHRHKLSADLEAKKGADQVDVIVQFNHNPTAQLHKRVLSRGGKMKRELGLIRGGAYRVPGAKLAELEADSEVAYVSPDRPLKSTASVTQVLDFHTDSINAPAGWAQGLDGTGIGVAVIDSGIANVSDLNANNVVYSQDFVGDNGGSAADLYGHGTHVTGILAGNGLNSTGPNFSYTFQGVAKNVNLINLRVLDANGAGTDSDVIAAIDTAIQLQSTYNIRIINLSLGRGVYESYAQDPLCLAVEQAWQAGIVVVVAAGNDGRDNSAGSNGYGTITAPGNDPFVITVGAMNTKGTADRTDDLPASYSSKGPTIGDQVVKPDLVAPGNAIVSLYTPAETLNQESPSAEVPLSLYQTNATAANSGTYYMMSGTSMATPMVSGAAALLLQQNPNLTPDQVKAQLMITAFRNLIPNGTVTEADNGQVFNVTADAFTVGTGYLDIQAALASTLQTPAAMGSAMSPVALVDTNGDIMFVANPTIPGASLTWGALDGEASGSSLTWGAIDAATSLTWGAVDGSSLTWGAIDGATSLTWGAIDSSANGSSLTWGAVDGATAGSSLTWGAIDSVTGGSSLTWGAVDGSSLTWGAVDDGSSLTWGALDAGSSLTWGAFDGATSLTWGALDLAGDGTVSASSVTWGSLDGDK
jgi:serine protease AprX